MSLNNIGDYLKRFKNMEPADSRVTNAALTIIKDVADIEVEKEQISVNKKMIFLKVHPVERNQIFLKKVEILKRINAQLGQQLVDDIR